MKIPKKVKRKHLSCRVNDTGGFTLLEVMVGIIIFTMGLLLLGSMMIVSIDGNVWSNKTTEVVQVLRDKVEEFRNTDVEDMESGSDVVNGMYRNWVISDEEDNLKRLLVVVRWNDKRDAAHVCSTTTFIQVGS